MKTENTLRMVRKSLLCFSMALGAGLLAACGSSDDGVASVDVGDGTFHAKDWVVGLDYRHLNNGETGKTGERGAFSFPKGQTVAFSIGQVTLGSFVSNADEDFVTPTRIADSGPQAVNIERLLIALDGDESSTNGTISLNADSATDATIVWNALTVASATGPIQLAADETGGVTVARSIPSVDDATRFLTNTNNCAFSGAFEGGYEGEEAGTPYTGDQALVLLAFDREGISLSVSSGLGDAADGDLGDIIGDKEDSDVFVINLWKEGGSSETAVRDFGSDSGVLAANLDTFPVVQEFQGESRDVNGVMERETFRLTLESYDRIAYESTTRRYAVGDEAGATVYSTESGDYRRAKEEVRDADYRIAGFYSDANNGDNPPEAEIGIYAFSTNGEEGSVRPYVGWFSSPLGGTVVYSNIGEGRISSPISYSGTPGDGPGAGTMMITDDSDLITVTFTHNTRVTGQDEDNNDVLESNGYGTFQDVSATTGRELLGGWCAL